VQILALRSIVRSAGFVLAAAALSSTSAQATQQFNRITREVKFVQKLDEQVPLDLRFRDSNGTEVRLGDLVKDKPVILSLVYYECPMLCTQVLNGLSASLRQLDSLAIGTDYDVVTISIDPKETPELSAKKKAGYVKVGEYAHAGGVVILTPSGKISRYFIDVVFPKLDMRLALVESSEGRIGSLVDAITLLCFRHDPATGKYGLVVTNVVRLGAGLTLSLLLIFIVSMLRRDRALARVATQPAGGT